MRSETSVLVGLSLMAAGAAGLVMLNLQAIPQLLASHKSDSVTVSVATPKVGGGIEQAAPQRDEAAEKDKQPGKQDEKSADGGGENPSEPVADKDNATAAEAKADESAPSGEARTTIVPDDTPLPSIRFAPPNLVMTGEMMKQIEEISAYVRARFGMMVFLVGHGDDASNPAEYVRVGRGRALSVMRVMVDQDVSSSRIGIGQPKMENDQLQVDGIAPGTVEIRIESRFAKPKKEENNAR